jgi:hypothetical protein
MWMYCNWGSYGAHLLVDEVLVIVLDVEFTLHLLDLVALHEQRTIHAEHLFTSDFTLAHQCNQLPSLFQLFTKSTELLCALRIATTSLANLAHFTTTETDEGIAIICILTSFKL